MALTHPHELGSDVRHALNREWRWLADSADLAPWRASVPELAGAERLDDVLALIAAAPDPVLIALLRLHQRGDELAGRVVLQAMLGALVRRAAHDPLATVDDYVTQMWLHVARYPLHRSRSVAANLLLDTLKSVVRERHDRTRMVPVALVPDQAAPAGGPSAHDIIGAACTLGLLSESTAAVLRTVYADGLAGQAAARRHELSVTALRRRCSDAVRRLAAHADELAELAC